MKQITVTITGTSKSENETHTFTLPSNLTLADALEGIKASLPTGDVNAPDYDLDTLTITFEVK